MQPTSFQATQKLSVEIDSRFISFDIPRDLRADTDIEQASYREQGKSYCFVNFHRHCEQTTNDLLRQEQQIFKKSTTSVKIALQSKKASK